MPILERTKKEMQERNLDILIRNNGFQFTDSFFPYTSGEIGPYYVQSAVVMYAPSDYVQAIRDMAVFMACETGNFGFEAISGGETRDWIFSLPLSVELKKPSIMIYNNGKILGNPSGKNVLHVADLNNEGSSPRDKWVPAVRSAGGSIEHILFYVDRMEQGVEEMKKLGLQRHALVELDENAWWYLKKKGVVSSEVYKNLMERGTLKEERDNWAKAMLSSDKGIKRLNKLLREPTEYDKVIKVIEHYEDIK